MKLITALKILQNLNIPIIQTQDAACSLGLTDVHTSQVLRRLALEKHIIHLSKSFWAIDLTMNPLLAPDYLLAPYPCYISLQSALYHHGMIDQIPRMITVITPGRTRQLKTPIGTFSIHKIIPEFFFGYEVNPKTFVKMATPEKALLDILYLKPAKSLWFKTLPELEIPRSFNKKSAFEMVKKIPSQMRRTLVENSLQTLLSKIE